MPDHFSALALPRRPWLEPDAVKDAFHRLGAARHPDAPAGDAAAFAAINAAWQVLRDPAARLRHLLELEFPGALATAAQIPAALADTFMRLAALRRTLEEFLRRRSAASGALAVALLAGERHPLERDLRAALAALESTTERALEEVRRVDAAWESRAAATATHLAALQQKLVFTAKWSDQLREALFQLGT